MHKENNIDFDIFKICRSQLDYEHELQYWYLVCKYSIK